MTDMPRTIVVLPGTKVFQGGRFVGTVTGPEKPAILAVAEDEDPTGFKDVVSKLVARRQTPPAQASPAETPDDRYARVRTGAMSPVTAEPQKAEKPRTDVEAVVAHLQVADKGDTPAFSEYSPAEHAAAKPATKPETTGERLRNLRARVKAPKN